MPLQVFRGIVAALFISILLLAGCKIDRDPPDRYALVYGVSDYNGTENDLKYTDDDAEAVAQILEEKGFTVYLRVSGEIPAPTKTQFENDFADIIPNIKRDDILLVYFSGHGGPVTGANDSEEDQFANDYAEAIVFSNGGVLEDYLTDNEFYILLSQCKATKKVVIIDACNSGGFIGQENDYDALNPDYTSDDETGSGVISSSLQAFFHPDTADIPPSEAIVITAAGEEEGSYESDSYGHGIFSYALLRAFDKGDNNGDGYIDTGEIYNYTRDFIDLFWNSIYTSSYQYIPHISGGPVDYVLCEAD